MMDARDLVPTAQSMVDAILPLAEAAAPEGDFMMPLVIRRRAGAATADVNISVAPQTKGRLA